MNMVFEAENVTESKENLWNREKINTFRMSTYKFLSGKAGNWVLRRYYNNEMKQAINLMPYYTGFWQIKGYGGLKKYK